VSLLDDLPDYDINPFDLGTMYENPEGGGQYVVKDDVREALRSDETVGQVAEALWEWENRTYPGSKLHETYAEFVASGVAGVRTLRGLAGAVLAALAGECQSFDQPAYANDKDWQRIKAFLDDNDVLAGDDQ